METWTKVGLNSNQGKVSQEVVAIIEFQHEEIEATNSKQRATREPTITLSSTKKDSSLTGSQSQDSCMPWVQNILTGSQLHSPPITSDHHIAQHLGSEAETWGRLSMKRLTSLLGPPTPSTTAENQVHGFHSSFMQPPPLEEAAPEPMGPRQMDERDNSLNLLDPGSLSAISKPNDKKLLHELFDHDIGS